MAGRSHGTQIISSKPFVGLQAQKFGGVFINARPRAGTRKTSPFDSLLTLYRFLYRVMLCAQCFGPGPMDEGCDKTVKAQFYTGTTRKKLW